MNQFVESLRRLYISGLLNDVNVSRLLSSGKITEDEKAYILKPLENP